MGRFSAIAMCGEWGPRFGFIGRFCERCIFTWVVLERIPLHEWVVEMVDRIWWPVMTGGRQCLPRLGAAARDVGTAFISLHVGAGVIHRHVGAIAMQREVEVFNFNVAKIEVALRLLV